MKGSLTENNTLFTLTNYAFIIDEKKEIHKTPGILHINVCILYQLSSLCYVTTSITWFLFYFVFFYFVFLYFANLTTAIVKKGQINRADPSLECDGNIESQTAPSIERQRLNSWHFIVIHIHRLFFLFFLCEIVNYSTLYKCAPYYFMAYPKCSSFSSSIANQFFIIKNKNILDCWGSSILLGKICGKCVLICKEQNNTIKFTFSTIDNATVTL